MTLACNHYTSTQEPATLAVRQDFEAGTANTGLVAAGAVVGVVVQHDILAAFGAAV